MTSTMQKIYDVEILFLCPSKNRAKTCTTHKILPSVKYFVSPDEFDDYIENVGVDNVVKLPDGIQVAPAGKCKTLNYLLDNDKKAKLVNWFSKCLDILQYRFDVLY